MTETAGWGVASGVGFTALAVAACRAIETAREEALIRDPYGAAFVQAAQDAARHTAAGVDVDVDSLWHDSKDLNPVEWLRAHDWAADAQLSTEIAERYGRPLPATLPEGMLTAQFVTAIRP